MKKLFKLLPLLLSIGLLAGCGETPTPTPTPEPGPQPTGESVTFDFTKTSELGIVGGKEMSHSNNAPAFVSAIQGSVEGGSVVTSIDMDSIYGQLTTLSKDSKETTLLTIGTAKREGHMTFNTSKTIYSAVIVAQVYNKYIAYNDSWSVDDSVLHVVLGSASSDCNLKPQGDAPAEYPTSRFEISDNAGAKSITLSNASGRVFLYSLTLNF